MTEYSTAKTGEYLRIFSNFQNCTCCEKDLKDNKDNLFLVAHSFPPASLLEKCSLIGTDNVRGQISENIFAPNDDYCLYIRCSLKQQCREKILSRRLLARIGSTMILLTFTIKQLPNIYTKNSI